MFQRIHNLAQLFPNENCLLKLPAGSELYRQGTMGDHMYVVKYGDLAIQANGKLVEIGSAGCLVGEECRFNNTIRRTTVIASSDCGLIPIDRNRLERLIRQTPGLLNHIKRLIELRLDILDLACGSKLA